MHNVISNASVSSEEDTAGEVCWTFNIKLIAGENAKVKDADNILLHSVNIFSERPLGERGTISFLHSTYRGFL